MRRTPKPSISSRAASRLTRRACTPQPMIRLKLQRIRRPLLNASSGNSCMRSHPTGLKKIRLKPITMLRTILRLIFCREILTCHSETNMISKTYQNQTRQAQQIRKNPTKKRAVMMISKKMDKFHPEHSLSLQEELLNW